MAEKFIKTEKKNLLLFVSRNWVLVFLLLEIIFFTLIVPQFFSLRVFQIIFFFGTAIFLLGTAEIFVIITGGIDLSVGYIMGFASISSAKLMLALTKAGFPPDFSILISIIITLIIGLIPGFINGILIAHLRVPPFIATFAMLSIVYGVSEILIKGVPPSNLPYLANIIGNGYFINIVPGKSMSFFKPPIIKRGVNVIRIIPNMVIFSFVFILIFAFILKRTKFGHHTYAVGGNIEAARRAGINVKRILILIYMLSSFFASLAGIVYVLKYVTGKADAGAGFLLDAIVGVVIGGASLYGGTGTVGGTILGCLILAVLETGLRIMGVPTFNIYIVVGVILIFAVLIEKFFPEIKQREV